MVFVATSTGTLVDIFVRVSASKVINRAFEDNKLKQYKNQLNLIYGSVRLYMITNEIPFIAAKGVCFLAQLLSSLWGNFCPGW